MEDKEKRRFMDQRLLERVWVGYFLSHRTLKIPSSINELVSGSKMVGKTEQKKRLISNHVWLVKIFYCISYMDYQMSTSPCKQTHSWPCTYDAVDQLQEFFFSLRDPVSSCWTHRDDSLAHSKRLDNMEAECHFHVLKNFSCRQLLNLFFRLIKWS